MEEAKINVIIVDDNKEFCNILNDYLSIQKDIVVTGIAVNGIEALKMIEEKKPDIIILDIIMPILDGLEVLMKIKKMKLDPMPRILVLSAVGDEKITQRAISLGADYYVIKPFDIELLIGKLRQYSGGIFKKPIALLDNPVVNIKKSQPADIITQITKIIDQIGVPAHIKGYMFLMEAINMVLSNNVLLLSAVTKDLYPLIGIKYNTTANRVEIAISHAIDVAWSIRQVDSINYEKVKPTNSEFISMVANKLK